MSYQSVSDEYDGTLDNGASTSATPLTWDLTSEQGRAAMIITVTASVAMTLRWEVARNAADLATPPQSLPHRIDEAVPANSTRQYIVGLNPALPVGRAWLINASGSNGAYRLDAGRRAHS